MSRRPRRRSRNDDFLLFDRNTTLGWRVTRRIGYEQGEKLWATGHARRVNDCNGQHIGYQLIQQDKQSDGLPSLLGPVMLTAREMDLIAGTNFKYGKSRTARMSEAERITRLHPLTRRMLPPEDPVERAQAKLKAFVPRHLQVAAAD